VAPQHLEAGGTQGPATEQLGAGGGGRQEGAVDERRAAADRPRDRRVEAVPELGQLVEERAALLGEVSELGVDPGEGDEVPVALDLQLEALVAGQPGCSAHLEAGGAAIDGVAGFGAGHGASLLRSTGGGGGRGQRGCDRATGGVTARPRKSCSLSVESTSNRW
jgi:hypothetical protein